MNAKSSFVTVSCLAVAALALVSHQRGEAEAPARPPALSKAEADGIIFERQQIMLQLDKDAKQLGEIAAGIQPPDKLAEVTRSIANSAKDSKAAFEAEVPGGRSKPEVWSQWADYSVQMDKFVQNAEQMAKLGQEGNLTAVTGMLADALPCKECHDVYRAPKKPTTPPPAG